MSEQKTRVEMVKAQKVEKLMLKTNQDFRRGTSSRLSGENDAAETNFMLALKGFRELNDTEAIAGTYVSLGEVLLEKNPVRAAAESDDAQNNLAEINKQREQAVRYFDKCAPPTRSS